MDVDVSDTPELSGGGPQSVPSRISVVLVDEAMAGGTLRVGRPCDDERERQPARGTVRENSLELPSVEGLMLQMHQRCLVGGGGPQSVPSRISVVLVDEANAGGTPGRKCPCENKDIRPLLAGRSRLV